MAQMKILHLFKSTKFSGAEIVGLTIMRLSSEHETIYASPDGPIRQVVEARGQKFYPLKGTDVKSIRSAIKQLHPDLIHAHDFTMASSAAWAAGGIPVVAHLHNNPPWLQKVHPKSVVFALALPQIPCVICVSESVEKEYIFRRLMHGKNTVIGNVVDIENVKALAAEPCDCGKVNLTFLGRLTSPKKPIFFCEIVKKVKESIPDITARMIGSGELEEQTKEYIWNNDLQDTIEMVGFQKNPYPYLKNSQLMVMPSGWEGFGLAAVEGLTLGKPVICSGVGGLKDIVDESCGAICTTVDEYAEEIEKLLIHKNERIKKQKNAITRSKQYADLERYYSKIEQVYSCSLKKKRK